MRWALRSLQVSGCPCASSPCPFPGGPSPDHFSLFQFDVIDNIMCLDNVLGFINPETQMPNTVLLARVGWVGQREGTEVLQWL